MRYILLIAVIFLLGCSSVEKREAVRASHDENMNIPAIDDMIVAWKKEYIEFCYMPVLKRIASSSPRPCETQLFQMLERRYSMNYTQEHVDMAADDLFFAGIKDKLLGKIKADESLRKKIRRKFKTMDDIIAYYKPKYTFRKPQSDKNDD
jgi:uncharacterized protein YceK